MKWELELKIISDTVLMYLYHLITLVYNLAASQEYRCIQLLT